MKQLTALAICLLAAGTLSAQNNAPKQKNTTSSKGAAAHSGTAAKKIKGPGVEGNIRDGHRHPIEDVHAFVYGKDSSIIASGFTDATGNYETNAVLPGVYSVKYTYPDAKYIMVTGVEIKKGLTPLNINMEPPTGDTSIAYNVLMPPPPDKKGNTSTSKKK